MRRDIVITLVLCVWGAPLCFSDAKVDRDKTLLEPFVNNFNNLHNLSNNEQYHLEDAVILSTQQTEGDCYTIEVKLNPSEYSEGAPQFCLVVFLNNVSEPWRALRGYDCAYRQDATTGRGDDLEQKVVRVEDEAQPESGVAVEEHSVQRQDKYTPCVSCYVTIDRRAAGVDELATLGVIQLDRHEPNVRHSLEDVLTVERQVQVTNGVRYILTIVVGYNVCDLVESESCISSKVCKVNILEKPWMKLPNGSKRRAILSNNCTVEWLFGDEGEVITNTNEVKNINTGSNDELIKVVQTDVEALPNQEKTLTNEQIHKIEEQIIVNTQLGETNDAQTTETNNELFEKKPHISQNQSPTQWDDNNIPKESSTLNNPNLLPEDKKRAIEDFINFFDNLAFNPNTDTKNSRAKRSFDDDLEMMNYVEKFQKLKKSVINAKYVYFLAENMVDYLEEKTKSDLVLDGVISATEQWEGKERIFFIKASVIILCQNCGHEDSRTKLCSGVINASNEKNPYVMFSSCAMNKKQMHKIGKAVPVPLDDLLLLRLAKNAIKKIEAESTFTKAFVIKKIVDAYTLKSINSLTRFSLELGYTNCDNTKPFAMRENCTIIDDLGTIICKIEIIDAQSSQNKKIAYTCNKRPIEEKISRNKNILDVNDPKVKELLQEAVQYLESQSTKKFKQKVVDIKSASTQLVAGVLTDIEFAIGYTTCASDSEIDIDNCVLSKEIPVRSCTISCWNRPWLDRGKQINVLCDELENYDQKEQLPNEEVKSSSLQAKLRSKRRIVGGSQNRNPNNPHYLALANESLDQYMLTTGESQLHKVVNVRKVTTQVVSGLMTRIDFDISPTNCLLKMNNSQLLNCEVLDKAIVIECHSEIWEQKWLKKKSIDIQCQRNDHIIKNKKQNGRIGISGSMRAKRKLQENIPGGVVHEKNLTDPKFYAMAEESLQKYMQTSGVTQQHKILSIDKVTTQVVAGTLTKLEFVISPTNCVNGQNSSDCQLLSNADVLRCNSSIWDRPWLEMKEITVNCTNEIKKIRTKRQVGLDKNIVGGKREEDSTNPKFYAMAEESIQKYLQTSGVTQQHKILSVDKVTTQVVAGILTTLEFVISPTNCVNGQNSSDCQLLSNADVLRCHSRVWDRPWLKMKQITVDCNVQNEKVRTKRENDHTLGGESEEDSTNPKFYAMAEESLQKYMQTSGVTQQHKILSVDKVTTQVVAGTLTKLEFVISPTNCVNGQNSSDCQLLSNADVLRCNSSIWDRPWLEMKEITVNCTNEIKKIRTKRQVGLDKNIVGGKREEDSTNPKFYAMAEESIQKYLQTSGVTQQHKILSVDKVTTQVVAGILTTLEFVISPTNCVNGQNSSDCQLLSNADVLRCNSSIWDRPWLEMKEITVNCTNEIKKIRTKRQVGLDKNIVGGKREEDSTNPKFYAMAEESIQKYLQTSGVTQQHKILSVDKVTTQVVAGILTTLEFVISPTNCVNGQNSSDCQLLSNADVLRCHSRVWDRPWLKMKQITVDCNVQNEKVRTKRENDHTLGGESEEDSTNPKFYAMAEESLQKYMQTSGVTQQHKILSVDKVTTQVVAGTLTKIEFVISPTNCVNGQNSSDCQLLSNADVLRCNSSIWDRPWLKMKEVTVNCNVQNEKVRTKRENDHMLGSKSEEDATNPKFYAMAEESLQKYMQTSGVTQQHKILSIDKVTTQVVAGILTTLEFVISPTNCVNGQNSSDCQLLSNADVLRCNSSIWDRPWLEMKEITVNCTNEIKKIRTKRQVGLDKNIVGGKREEDSTNPKFYAMAEESIQKYLQTSGVTQQHKILSVDKVTTQVVAGILTTLEFVISPTNCVNGQNSSDCQLLSNADVLRCHSRVWDRPWLKMKEISVDCNVQNEKVRTKRENDHTLGGESEEDSTNPKFYAMAEESLQKYMQTSGVTQQHKILSVDKVTTQVVAGTLTKIEFVISPTNCVNGQNSSDCQLLSNADVLRCNSSIWDRPWLKMKEITVNCNVQNEKVRTKRENDHMLGSKSEEDATNPKFYAMAEESLQKYMQTSGVTQQHKILSIDKVTTQVVAGTLTKLEFVISPTNCVNGQNSSDCQLLSNADVLQCHSRIWERPWLEIKEITVNCTTEKDRTKRQLVGGVKEINPADPKYFALAEESLQKFVMAAGVQRKHTVVNLKKVTMQVVEGLLTVIEFDVLPTNCYLDQLSPNCQTLYNADLIPCRAEIWERAWLKKKDIKVDCDQKSITKRSIKLDAVKIKNIDNIRISAYDSGKLERKKRQMRPDEDYIDDDTRFYYADRAVKQVNDNADTHNLQKLISIHAVQNTMQQNTHIVEMYIETAYTYCLRNEEGAANLNSCDEMEGLNHRLCFARLRPSSEDDLVVKQVHVVCDDDPEFPRVTGLSIIKLIKASISELEKSRDAKYKLVHQGEPYVIPSLDSKIPTKLSFIVAPTNCTKNVNLDKKRFECFIDPIRSAKSCRSLVWLEPKSSKIKKISVTCRAPQEIRKKRSIDSNTTSDIDNVLIQQFVQDSLVKLEMSSLHRYKQRVVQINNYSTKITTGKLTTIDFDVGYTSCLKFEWVDNITNCEFLQHLPKRHCVSNVWERLWINNGREIEVNCRDYDDPSSEPIDLQTTENAKLLANEAIKHIEAKYPHPRKQKLIRIFSVEKQLVAGIHYRMKLEVGSTNCTALSITEDCVPFDSGLNKFCRVNVWLRPTSDHPPTFRVTCDYQESTNSELYRHVQAEHLFYDFVTTYKPDYIDDHVEMLKRFNIFKENVRRIHEFNVYERGTARYAVTRFTDLSYDEFSAKYMGLRMNLRDPNEIPMRMADIPNVKLPGKFDWREHGAVTEVKNQGSCGSCWAFSVTGNVEGQWKLKSGELVSLSEQELVDCDNLDNGCSGGLPSNAYKAIEQLGGLESEADYPYAGDDAKCAFNRTMSRVRINSAVNITTNETAIAQWLVRNGPISIGINANAMQFYVGGVSHPWRMLCSPTNLDHGVLIVGYGEKDYPLFNKKLPYWIVKNSWGASWGEQGYYRVYRGDGTCGVNLMASSALIA